MKRLFSFLLLTLTIMFATVNTMQANAMSADTPDAEDYMVYNITATGNYNLTMDLNRGILTTEANAEEGLYIIGPAAGGWSGEYIAMTKSSTGNTYTYTGTLKGGEMKFATLLDSDSKAIYGDNNLVAKTNGTNISTSYTAGTTSFELAQYTSTADYKFTLAEGYYSITVNKDNMTLTVNDYKAKGLYLITSFNEDGSVNWSDATAMTQNTDGTYTTSSDITVVNSGKLMFAEIYGDESTLWGSYITITDAEKIPQLITPKTHNITNSAMTTSRAFNTVAGLLNITVDITSDTKTLTVNHFYPDVLYVEGNVNGANGWDDKELSVAISRGENGTYHVEHAFVTGEMKFAVNNFTFGEGDWVATSATYQDWPTKTKAYSDTDIEYAITPYTSSDNDLKFNLQSGYYDFTVDLANQKVILKLYNPNSIVLYGDPTGQGEPRNSDFTFTKNPENENEYNIKAHLKAGILRVAKLVDGTPYQLSPTKDKTTDTDVSGNVTPASTRQESTITLSQYYVAVPTDATAYGYEISGGYYDITIKDFQSNPYIVFNDVRDNLRVIGEVNQDWNIEIDNQICGTSTTNNKMTPTLNGFEYKGYLHGLEMKFCEQHSKKGEKDEYGRFYTHAWGPMRKSVIEKDGTTGLPITDNEMGNSYTEIKATGSFDIEDMAADDDNDERYDRYDSKFDVYPGYYEFTVNFLTNKLTVSKFVPYQRIVVAPNVSDTEGYATFMCAYSMNNAVTSCLYKRASGTSNPCEGSDNDFTNTSNWTPVSSSNFGFYSCSSVNDQNQLVLTEVTNIAHSTPYIIHATPGTYYLKLPENATIAEKTNRWIYNNWDYNSSTEFTPFNNYYASKTTDPYNKYNPCVNTAGILRGNWHMGRELASNSDKFRYLMQKQSSDGLALYYCEANKDYILSPYSCYLELDQPLSSGAKVLTFSFDDEASTAINETSASDNTVKGIYTIDGIKTNTMHKGINIIRMADGSVRKIMNK